MTTTMMDANCRPAKRAKKNNRVTADFYDFMTFPDQTGPGEQPFRQEVRCFLSRHARLTFQPSSVFSCLMTWQTLLRVADLTHGPDLSPVIVVLDVVEEDVTRSTRSVYCDQCRVVGWSGHPVCRKRYHFIIRSVSSQGSDGFQSCSKCGSLLLPDSSCKCCSSVITEDDLEDWVSSQFEDNTHLLHGVVHSNGYGHLITINGREGGSNFLSGRDIMNFWDRLCTRLNVRKVSVMDMSKKYKTEYRLIHAITKGHSWFSDWGYEFISGSYALTRDAYQNAVDTLSSMPVSPLLFQGRKLRTQLQDIIAFYKSLSDSELLTMKDLFSFLLRLIQEAHRLQQPNTSKKFQCSYSNVLCSWTRRDVESVQQAMIKVLVAAAGKSTWITRRALKGVMCKTASPELLDYCLKHLGGELASNGMGVHARCNPISNDLEFRLQHSDFNNYRFGFDANYPSKEHIKSDLKYLFDSLLCPENLVNHCPQATVKKMVDSATKILDCKQFMKDYQPNPCNPLAIHLWCHVELSDQPKDDPTPPAELLVLPVNATVGDLKSGVSKAFQEVYVMFRRFEVEELLEYGSIGDYITLKLLIGLSGSIRIKGRCSSKHGLLRYRMERGTENWVVDCTCGAKDDDGEKMLACDTCGVWQHTRCAGIENNDTMLEKFVCIRCINTYCKKSTHSDLRDEANRVSLSGLTCRGEKMSSGTPGIGGGMSVAFVVVR